MNKEEESQLKLSFLTLSKRVAKIEVDIKLLKKLFNKQQDLIGVMFKTVKSSVEADSKKVDFPIDESRQRPGLI